MSQLLFEQGEGPKQNWVMLAKKKKLLSGGHKHHIAIEVELLVEPQPQQNHMPTPRRALSLRNGTGASRGQTVNRDPRTYGLWLLSNGKELPLDKDEEQPIIVLEAVRPLWKTSCTV